MIEIQTGMRVYVKDTDATTPGWGHVTEFDPGGGSFTVQMDDPRAEPASSPPGVQYVWPDEIGVRGWPDEFAELDRLDELTDELNDLLSEAIFYSEQEAYMENLVAEREAILRSYV